MHTWTQNLKEEKHVPISYLRGLSKLWSKTGKEGITTVVMCEGHREQQLQRAVTTPLGLQRPDCTHLMGKHTSPLVPCPSKLTWAFTELHQDLSLGSSKQPGQSNLRRHPTDGAANCNNVGTCWAVLSPFKTIWNHVSECTVT